MITRRMIRQSDVAEKAGVTQTTVSLVFREDPRITPETRSKVLSVAQSLGYWPQRHFAAKQLALHRQGKRQMYRTIGSLSDLGIGTGVRNSFTEEIFWGMAEACQQKDMSLMLLLNDGTIENLKIHLNHLDGLVCSVLNEKAAEIIKAYRIPMVTHFSPGTGFPTIEIDHGAAMTTALEYLHRLGHEKIAYIGPDLSTAISRQRWEAFLSFRQKTGVKPVDEWILNATFLTYDQLGWDGFGIIWNRSKVKPTAVMAYNDMTALSAMARAKSMGLKVPSHVSFMGIDGIRESRLSDPVLSTIKIDLAKVGALSIHFLHELFSGHGCPEVGLVDFSLQTGASVFNQK
ncbi:LacI family DNA-binding transcriptional regulator [Oscillatoria laete-virens NRMC-F 0139]|nr:LacI family DNA-binding transcriptional regulator [Oscillatoria laete-virens]MDL5052985.1 LacI family DNA-binding transcriptional regulator [Oscillatoria laete-virens NRMC-F 0139]